MTHYGPVAIPQIPKWKEDADSYNFDYQEFDDETLERLANRVGFDESPQMAKELCKFFISLIQPSYFSVMKNRNDKNFISNQFGLPIFMYQATNYMFRNYINFIKSDSTWFKVMPQWYLDEMMKHEKIEQLNAYVVFVLNTYEGFIRDSIVIDNNTSFSSNEVRRKYFEDRFPWVREERKKTLYMIQRIQNRLMNIAIDGIRKQSDHLFLYFYNLVFRDIGQQISFPDICKNLFLDALPTAPAAYTKSDIEEMVNEKNVPTDFTFTDSGFNYF